MDDDVPTVEDIETEEKYREIIDNFFSSNDYEEPMMFTSTYYPIKT